MLSFLKSSMQKNNVALADGITHNQTDYFLALRRFKCSINIAKSGTYPGTDINGDHDLVMMTVKRRWVMAAHRRLSSAPRSNDDIDWPILSLMLSFHDLRGPATPSVHEAL